MLGSCALAASASAQAPVRLVAPTDCLTNAGCGPGLERVYGVDVTGVPCSLEVADAVSRRSTTARRGRRGVQLEPARVAPDVLTLDDDRGMVGPTGIAPVVRASVLRAYGRRARDIRRRLNARLARAHDLGAARPQPAGDRRPAARGGGREFIDANGLGGSAAEPHGAADRRRPPGVRGERDARHLYAEALRAGGYCVAVRSVGDPSEAVRRLRRGRIPSSPPRTRAR